MRDTTLGLGWENNALVSPDAEAGAMFYTRSERMVGVGHPSSGHIRAFVSSNCSCFAIREQLECYVLNQSQVSSPWSALPDLRSPHPDCGALECFGFNAALDSGAVAVVGTLPDDRRFVSVHTHSNTTGAVSWQCLSGCANDFLNSESGWIWSEEESFGQTIALDGAALAVGIPNSGNDTGAVEVYRAAGGAAHGRDRWMLDTRLHMPGTVEFGRALAMRDGFLVVGSPGAGRASVHVYTYDRTGAGGSLSLSPVCSVVHSDIELDSLLGRSVDLQVKREGHRAARAVILAGAPGINRVFSIFVDLGRAGAARCAASTMLQETGVEHDDVYAFGQALSIDHNWVFVGAPDYYGETAYGQVIDGLVYAMLVCFEGETAPSKYSPCQACPKGTWSSGGQAQCTSCIPEHSVPDQESPDQCAATCETGFFGPECQLCSVYMQGKPDPGNGFWVDHEDECYFKCLPGFAMTENGTTCGLCTLRAEDYNGIWLPDTCTWTCNATFFNYTNSTTPDCVTCSRKAELLSIPKPENSEWIDGLEKCVYGPQIGFRCEDGACSACSIFPENAEWTDIMASEAPRCSYACKSGFFGNDLNGNDLAVCKRCSVLLSEVLPQDQRPTLPRFAAWSDAVDACTADGWVCVDGFDRSSVADVCCPTEIPNSNYRAGVAPCEVECDPAFWWDDEMLACRACPLLPEGAEWAPGNCTFIPKLGYSCESRSCAPCPTKTNNSHWTRTGQECSFACDPLFFGHPVFKGCVPCSKLQDEVIPEEYRHTKPVHSRWDDSLEICTSDSWACNTGYSRSNKVGAAYCCPDDVPNSTPNSTHPESDRVCPLLCDPGFTWSDVLAACVVCGEKPPDSLWVRECAWECDSAQGLFGEEAVCVHGGLTKEESEPLCCFHCRTYRERLGDATGNASTTPARAFFVDDGTARVCESDDWQCPEGYNKSMETSPPGCCPLALPIGAEADANSPMQCGYRCIEGFVWDALEKECIGCPPQSLENAPPMHGVWEGLSCSYGCAEGYHPHPRDTPTKCLSCDQHATAEGWPKPEYAEWLEPPESVDCTRDAWDCTRQLSRHPKADLCCGNRVPQITTSGSWADEKCEWRCDQGLFPTVPAGPYLDFVEVGDSLCAASACVAEPCMICGELLTKLGIPLPKGVNLGSLEDAKGMTKCAAALSVAYDLDGLTLATFTSEVEKTFLAQVADGAGVSEKEVKLLYVRPTSGRRAGENEKLAVGVQLSNLEPASVSPLLEAASGQMSVQSLLRADAESPTGLARRLSEAGVSVQIGVQDGSLDLRSVSADFGCGTNYVENTATGECCPSSTFNEPKSDRTRLMWKDVNGIVDTCAWECRPPYRLFGGNQCMLCSESNEEQKRFKPSNAYWDDESEDCTQWICNEGYVRSATGYACIELERLERDCASLTRCALCAKDPDCVWCPSRDDSGGSCKAGYSWNKSNMGCQFGPNGGSDINLCTCEANTCKIECQHADCASCIEDKECGWCGGTQTCMLGSFFSPTSGQCSVDWTATAGPNCTSDISLWVIGLACAGVSMCLIGIMCCFFVIKLRAIAREEATAQMQRYERRHQTRQLTRRFLSSFPTFRYQGKHVQLPAGRPCAEGESASCANFAEDEDGEQSCTICLGVFVMDEELRMLPCLHTFHAPCVDQWLELSQECPLCRTSVVNSSNQHLAEVLLLSAEAGAAEGGAPEEPAELEEDEAAAGEAAPEQVRADLPPVPRQTRSAARLRAFAEGSDLSPARPLAAGGMVSAVLSLDPSPSPSPPQLRPLPPNLSDVSFELAGQDDRRAGAARGAARNPESLNPESLYPPRQSSAGDDGEDPTEEREAERPPLPGSPEQSDPQHRVAEVIFHLSQLREHCQRRELAAG